MERFYVEFDEDTSLWCVFDSSYEPHKAKSTWCDQRSAQADADRLNYGDDL